MTAAEREMIKQAQVAAKREEMMIKQAQVAAKRIAELEATVAALRDGSLIAELEQTNDSLRKENQELRLQAAKLEGEILDLADTVVNLTQIIEPGKIA